MPTAKAVAGKTLLSPTDHTLILVDFQPQMAFAKKSIDGVVLRNNAALLANAAEGFKVSTIRRRQDRICRGRVCAVRRGV